MKSIEHVLVLTPGFPENEEDFLCIPPLQAFLEAFKIQHPTTRVTVVALHYPYQARRYQWKGIPVHALGGRNLRDPRRLLLWRQVRKTVARIHREHPVSVLHSLWLEECTWLGQELAAKHGFSQVATLQGQDARSTNRYLKKLDFEALRVIAISEKGKAKLQQNAPANKIQVIPWGLRGTELAWQPGKAKRSIDILGVGGLVPVKRYDRFVRAIADLTEHHPNLKAVLVGEGKGETQLKRLANDLKLGPHLEFKGLLPRPEVLDLMANSKVLLHPASYEGQGYVFLEALSRGMHVVSGPVGIARPMDKWAISVHTTGLAAATDRFLKNPVDEEPRCLFTMDATLEAVLELYAT